MRSFLSSAILCFITVLQVKSQPLAPLNGACLSSLQCVGVAVCIQQVCQCPIGYVGAGPNCAFASVGVGAGLEQGFPAGAPLTAPGFPLPAPGALQPSYLNPGAVCGASAAVCGGGSFCYQGSCCCPQGYIVQQSSCIVAGPGIGGPGLLGPGFGGPFGPSTGPVGPVGPVPSFGGLVAPGLPCSAGMSCSGGAFCYQSQCCCPQGYIVQQQTCVISSGPAIGPAFGPAIGPAVGPPQFVPGIGPMAPIAPGLPCNVGAVGGYGYRFGYPGATCGGGSFCYQSQCCCPQGYIIQQQTCTISTAVVGAGPGLGFGPGPLPFGAGPFGPGAIGPSAIGAIAPGLPCSAGAACGGGAFCYQSQCCCPMGYIVQQQTCVVSTVGVGAVSPYGAFGALGPAGLSPGFGAGLLGGPGFGLSAYGYGLGAAALPLGSPCGGAIGGGGCGPGAWCMRSVCSCRSAFIPFGGGCILKKRAKALNKENKDESIAANARAAQQKEKGISNGQL